MGRSTQLSDGRTKSADSRLDQVHFVKAVNEKFKKSVPFLGVHYRAYCCSRCMEGFVVRRWRRGCAPNNDDALTIVKPIAMSPHELRRWFSLHHHLSWPKFLKTPSSELAKRLERTTTRAKASKQVKPTAAKEPARVVKESPKKTSTKKASPAPKRLPAASKKTRLGKERTTAQKMAGATGRVNYKGIEADLDATLELLKKSIN